MMSVCRPSASIATIAAASQAVQRATRQSTTSDQAMKSSAPARPDVDAQLRIGRLTGHDRGAGAGRGRTGVAGAVAQRMAEHGRDPVAQALPVALGARVREAVHGGVPGRSALEPPRRRRASECVAQGAQPAVAHRRARMVGVVALTGQFGLRIGGGGCEVRIDPHEGEAGDEHADGGERETEPPLRPQRCEHGEAERERQVGAP